MNPHVTEFNTLYDAIIKKKDFLNRKTYGYSPPLLTLALQYTSTVVINMWRSNEGEYKSFLVYKSLSMLTWVKCGNMLCHPVIF